MDFKSKIGNYLNADDDINQHEVIMVHGKLSKIEKGRYNQFLINPVHTNDDNINVLCAKIIVGNVVLNSSYIINIF